MNNSATISSGYPFTGNYLEVEGSNIHYIDEGAGDPILFLHGNPTWSYLWRNVIPHVTAVGRCIAPDLIGMGRSDKPDIEYRFVDHVRYLDAFIEKLGLTNITLVVHDWGSALGFHYAQRHQDNIKGLVFLEAGLGPMPDWEDLPPSNFEFFERVKGPDSWEMIVDQNFFVEQLLQGLSMRQFTEEEMRFYREPFVEPASRKPLWRWPQEVAIGGEPADVNDALVAYSKYLPQTDVPKLLFYATPGFLISAEVVDWCRQNLKNLTTVDVGEGIHFHQEENPHAIGEGLAEWFRSLWDVVIVLS